jgi:hypothetical protein
MPLRDHFRPPVTDVASWEELHGAWPGAIAFRLNDLLPSDYRSGVKIHLGTAVEIDVPTFELQSLDEPSGDMLAGGGLEWKPASPTVLLESDELTPPEYEVQVYDQRHTRRLVAAVEIVSPRNKDRAEARKAFVSKCHALLQQDVCVTIVDLVTERSSNLFAELAERIGAKTPATARQRMYAVSCRNHRFRGRVKLESWEHALELGAMLPTLPLWICESQYVPLELERTYEDTCKGLRIS